MFGYEDIIIVVFLLIFGIVGIKKGLIISVFTLAAWIIGVVGSIYFSEFMANWLSEAVGWSATVVTTVSYIATFIILVLLVRVIGKVFKQLAKSLALGFLDRIGGFIIGVIKGAFLASFLLFIIVLFTKVKPDPNEHSVLYKWTQPIMPWTISVLQSDKAKSQFDSAKKAVEDVKEDITSD